MHANLNELKQFCKEEFLHSFHMTVFTVSSHLLYDITYCSALSLFKSHYVYSRESHFQ